MTGLDFPVIIHVIPVYDDLTPTETFALLAEHGCLDENGIPCGPLEAREKAGMEPSWSVAIRHAETGALVGFLERDGGITA